MRPLLFSAICLAICCSVLTSCRDNTSTATEQVLPKEIVVDTPQYFLLRPKLEKEYGYSHAVQIGNDLKISGAVSMDDNGVIVAPGNMEQQMKNCYSDLEKVLKNYWPDNKISITWNFQNLETLQGPPCAFITSYFINSSRWPPPRRIFNG